MIEQGLPVTFLLLFTVLIWGLHLMILLSSPGNKVNQWCCISGFLLSLGVWKEYLFYGGFFADSRICLLGVRYHTDELINSVLTAVLYYLAMPCGVICNLYFCSMDKRKPRLFRILRLAVFLPVLVFAIIYPWSQTKRIICTHPEAFLVVGIYNLLYGMFMTILVMLTLFRERKSHQFSQRRFIAVFVLLPLWYWLITIFPVHMLKLEKLYKLWQGNVLIIFGLLFYYLYLLFHKGIWGLRLNRQYFDWSENKAQLPEDIRYIIHMLKNETAKLRLSTQFIRELGISEAKDELDILDRSITHIEEFVRRSNLCSGDIQIELECIDIKALFEEIADELSEWKGTIKIEVGSNVSGLYCDPYHMKEVLCNLAANAIDSMGEDGTLTLAALRPKKDIVLLRVSDTGHGIPEKDLERIFNFYYTSYVDYSHFGLGLAYCKDVIKRHNGYINVRSSTEPERHGTEFTLCLPRGFRGGVRQKKDDKSINCRR